MKIIVMEDSHELNDCIRAFLNDHNHEAHSAFDGTEGLEICCNHRFDLAIVDLFMPNIDGLEVIMSLSKNHPGMKIIAISGVHGSDEDYLAAAKIFGADITIRKPFTMEQLLNDINYVFEN